MLSRLCSEKLPLSLVNELFVGLHLRHPALKVTHGYCVRDEVATEVGTVGIALALPKGKGGAALKQGPDLLIVMDRARHGNLDTFLEGQHEAGRSPVSAVPRPEGGGRKGEIGRLCFIFFVCASTFRGVRRVKAKVFISDATRRHIPLNFKYHPHVYAHQS